MHKLPRIFPTWIQYLDWPQPPADHVPTTVVRALASVISLRAGIYKQWCQARIYGIFLVQVVTDINVYVGGVNNLCASTISLIISSPPSSSLYVQNVYSGNHHTKYRWAQHAGAWNSFINAVKVVRYSHESYTMSEWINAFQIISRFQVSVIIKITELKVKHLCFAVPILVQKDPSSVLNFIMPWPSDVCFARGLYFLEKDNRKVLDQTRSASADSGWERARLSGSKRLDKPSHESNAGYSNFQRVERRVQLGTLSRIVTHSLNTEETHW